MLNILETNHAFPKAQYVFIKPEDMPLIIGKRYDCHQQLTNLRDIQKVYLHQALLFSHFEILLPHLRIGEFLGNVYWSHWKFCHQRHKDR